MRKIIALGIAIMMATSLTWAVDFSLGEKEQQALSPEAQKTYNQAIWNLDHIRYPQALDSFKQTAEMEPGNAPIRFLLARFAITEGKKKMGDEALMLFRHAETAYNEIIALGEQVKPAELERAQTGLEAVKELIIKQAERDARRIKVGKDIVQEHAKRLYPEEDKKLEEKAMKMAAEDAKKLEAKKNQQPGAPQRMMMPGAMPGMMPGGMMPGMMPPGMMYPGMGGGAAAPKLPKAAPSAAAKK